MWEIAGGRWGEKFRIEEVDRCEREREEEGGAGEIFRAWEKDETRELAGGVPVVA